LADLQCKTAVLPWRNSKRILVQTNVGAVIGWIESAVESGLREEINLRADLRVQKQRKPIIEKVVDTRVDQAGRRLLEIIKFQIERATQACAKIILEAGDRQRVVEAVESIIDVESVCRACEHAQAQNVRFHAAAVTPFVAEKRTSNSVQSFSE